MACCSTLTPITALLALDVASCDWRSALSDRFVWTRMMIHIVSKPVAGVLDFSRKINLAETAKIGSKNVTDTNVSCATARKMVLQQFALGYAR